MESEYQTNEQVRIFTYQHTILYRIFKKLRLLDHNGLLKVIFVGIIMLFMWGLVFLAATYDGVAWPLDGTVWPPHYGMTNTSKLLHDTTNTQSTGEQLGPSVWAALLPQSPIRSLGEYYHIEKVSVLIPEGAEITSCMLEIRSAEDNMCIAKIDYRDNIREFISEGKAQKNGWTSEGRLSESQIRRIGRTGNGKYLATMYVNGVRCSNTAAFTIDSSFGPDNTPILQLVPLGIGPDQTLPYLGVRAMGPESENPELTNKSIAFSELIVNGAKRKQKAMDWKRQVKPLHRGQQSMAILYLGNYEPAIKLDQLHIIKASVGKNSSTLKGLKLPLVYDVAFYLQIFFAFPLFFCCTVAFDIEINRFCQWIAREKRIRISQENLGEILGKLQSYYRSKWISLLCLVIAIGGLCFWINNEFTNGKWGWQSYPTAGTWERPTVAGVIAILYLVCFNFLLYSCVFKFIGWIWLLFKLSRFPFKVDPIHPDLCGGFAPLNLVQKTIGYLICGSGIVIVSSILNNYLFLDIPLSRSDHITITIIFVILAPLLFVFPLSFFRRKLWWAKRNAITWVDTMANDTLGDIKKLVNNREDKNMLEVAANFEFVDFVGNYRERIMSMRALPFDFKTFKSFLALAYTPFLSLMLPFLPGTFQKITVFFI